MIDMDANKIEFPFYRYDEEGDIYTKFYLDETGTILVDTLTPELFDDEDDIILGDTIFVEKNGKMFTAMECDKDLLISQMQSKYVNEYFCDKEKFEDQLRWMQIK